jgi:hypothetical protein
LKEHPLYAKHNFEARGRYTYSEEPQPALHLIDLQERPEAISRVYNEHRRWLLSCPVLDSNDRLLAVIDYLYEEPLSPADLEVLDTEFAPLLQLVPPAIYRTRSRRVAEFERHHFHDAEDQLRMMRTDEALHRIISAVRDAIGCSADCGTSGRAEARAGCLVRSCAPGPGSHELLHPTG